MTVIPSKRPFSPGWTDEQGPPRKRRKLSELWHDSPVDADPSLHEVDAAHFASHIEPWKRPLHSYDSNITGSTVIGHRRISSDPFPLLHEGDVRYISHLVRLRKREIEGCNASGGDKAVLDQHLRPLLNQANTDDNRCLEETPGSMGKNQTYPPQDKRDDTQSIIVKKTALPSQNYVISPNSWLGYADQLEGLRDVEETPNMFLRIKELYTDIFRCYENMKGDIYNTTHLRRYFTMNRLIYIPDVRTWVETDMVVWTGKKAGKLGRKRLDCWYGPLQAFFVNALGVPATVSQLAVPPTGKITVKRPRKKATPFVNLPFRRSMGPSPSPTLGSVGVQMPSCQTIPQPRRSVRLQWKALALERDSAKANEKEKDLIEKDQQNPVYDVDFNTSNQPTFSIPICLKKNHLQIEAKHSIPSCDFSGPTITQTPFSFGTAPAISNAISLLQQQRVRQNRHRTGVVSEKYKTLLQFVIERAKISGFPSNLESILWVDCPSMFGYLDGAEVGSAGELFVRLMEDKISSSHFCSSLVAQALIASPDF